ncbi:MAG: hypothetical protein IH624_08450 [Phycisphaerae bacterium]|nr:hypothetical protein [Phycisphaerae bacterium]
MKLVKYDTVGGGEKQRVMHGFCGARIGLGLGLIGFYLGLFFDAFFAETT